jgi:hypothetical protein
MAHVLVFMEKDPLGKGVLNAGSDGSVRKIDSSDHSKHPRSALWSFVSTGEADWGMLVNHHDNKLLMASLPESKAVIGLPRFANERNHWWRMAPNGAQGHISLVPYGDRNVVVTVGSGTATLKPLMADALYQQAWYPRPLETASYEALPSFNDAANDAIIDETFYTIEVVTLAGAQNKRLYLTIEDEHGMNAPVTLGTDRTRSAAHFQLVPLGTGRILSADVPLGSTGRASEERVCALESAREEIEMINLNGSHSFVSGDRVALRTEFLYYIGWKQSNDLTANASTPNENETFIIRKIGGQGDEIRIGDSFALQAGNGRHLTEDRGSAEHQVSAAAPHIDKWETFVLGAPKMRSFHIYGKKTGHPLTLGELRNDSSPLIQRFGRVPAEFELADRGEGMVTLRYRNRAWGSDVVPLSGGVDAGQALGVRDRGAAPGILFRLQAAPPTPWPDTPDLTMDKYRDQAEDMTRKLAGGLVSMAGTVLSTATGIPGGAAVFGMVFELAYPAKKVSLYDILTNLRADIHRDIENFIASNAATQAKTALQNAREQYLVTYLNARRNNMNGGTGLAKARADVVAARERYIQPFNFLALEMAGAKVKESEQNLGVIRYGLPVYALCVAEYVNVLQEIALIHAYQPKLVLPDVWLKTRDQYVNATPKDGVRYGAVSDRLAKALRVLNKSGDKILRHGDTVVLRSPSGTNVTAAGGGGGALDADTPSSRIGAHETFTIERISSPPSAKGDAINSGDSIALKASNGTHYVSAPDGGSRLTATANNRAAWETFQIEMAPFEVKTDPPALKVIPGRPYSEYLDDLRTYAANRYNDVRDRFELLVKDRTSTKRVESGRWDTVRHTTSTSSFEYALYIRDHMYNFEIDAEIIKSVANPIKPQGWDDPKSCVRLLWGIDGYREHLRRIYCFFKYRYFHALRPLLTIADETENLCDQMWTDPLLATEFAYSARIAPKFTLS